MKDAVKLVRLYERRSKSGRPYFVGFLGQSRVLMMRDDRAEVNGDTIGVWDVFVKARDEQPDQRPRPQPTGYSHDGPADTRPQHHRRSKPARPQALPAQTTSTSNTATNKRAREINERLANVSLNDAIPEL